MGTNNDCFLYLQIRVNEDEQEREVTRQQRHDWLSHRLPHHRDLQRLDQRLPHVLRPHRQRLSHRQQRL